MNENFTSVSNGKKTLETAIIDKGGTVSKNKDVASFEELKNGIQSIKVGDYSTGDKLYLNKIKFNEKLPSELWHISLDRYDSYIKIYNQSYIYVAFDTHIQKYNLNKELIWDTNINCTIYTLNVDDKGNVYTGGIGDSLFKLNSDGVKIWEKDYNFDYVYSIAIDFNGYVYVSSSNNRGLSKLTPDGERIWLVDTNVGPNHSSIIIDKQGYIYCLDNRLIKVNPNGSIVNTFNYSGCSLAIDNSDNLYIGSTNGTLTKINTNGEQLMKVNVDTSNAWITAITIDNDGYIYAGGSNLTKISSTGNKVWDVVGNSIKTICLDSQNYIYTGGYYFRKFTNETSYYEIVS
ncbi:hypothetical protein FC967_20465 [Clostridium sporogenes]|nr:hypothetical protein [Clostridium sporogenes]